MVKGKLNRSSGSSRGWCNVYGVIAAIVVVIAAVAVFPFWRNNAPPTTVSAPLTPYDNYVLKAKAKGWYPTDPIEKLTTTVDQFGNFFELLNQSGTLGLMKMVVREWSYLLNVLKDTNGRTFDVTYLLYSFTEMMQRSYFKAMKGYLHSGNQLINRQRVGENAVDSLLMTMPKVFRYLACFLYFIS